MTKKTTANEMNLFTDYGELEGNIFAETTIEAVTNVEESATKINKIEDFGEKIGGARKDIYAAYREMIKEASEEEIDKLSLEKTFPAPNYKKMIEKGIESWKVDLVRVMREIIPRKPTKYSWKKRTWAAGVREIRDIAVNVLEDRYYEEEIPDLVKDIARIEDEYFFKVGSNREKEEEIEDKLLIYKIMGHEQNRSALEFREVDRYENEDDSIKLVEKSGAFSYKTLVYGATKTDVLERYRRMDKEKSIDEKIPKKKKNPFQIYRWRNASYCFIGCKVGKECVEVQSPFEKPEEAMKYMKENMAELEEKLEKYKKVPYEREAENNPRVGDLKRTGDVMPEQFQETFGFRGVEFGTWVENKKRQEDLNKAYDALMDMAEVLELPPRALSLDGTLGLAFGARGRGGQNAPLAHYEPAKVVINLTKKNGAGSLGHEWMHAVDNYFGRKEKNIKTSMLTNNTSEEAQNVSADVMSGFRLLQTVINESDMLRRCQNLDKHRTTPYWTLPEEMAARSFEVYLKSKLEEKGITNDYLVNYKTEESWREATENGYMLEKTYPYPTKEETEDIKTAYEYLFDSIRFKAHDKEYELYSSSDEKIAEMLKESKLMLPKEVTTEQKSMQKMSAEVLGIELKYFEGASELHGRYDEDLDIMYVNGKSETSLEWTYWHEAFHIMKKHEPELYEDILKYIERNEIFTKEQIQSYRKAVNQPKLSENKVVEEMLADAFADMKTGLRILEEMAEKNEGLAKRLAEFTKKIMKGIKKFLKSEEVQEKYPEVALTNLQFSAFTKRIEENVCSLSTYKGKLAKESTGYKILKAGKIINSPYKYKPEKQKKFDIMSAKALMKKYAKEAVGKVIQEISPLGEKNKKYGEKIIQEVKTYSR